MSDGFDKEAEREKLREKFAEDEKKREHTQRMSELLLQGATMTNRHCEACGDPIFRHDGREFCPTCHATEDGYAVPADDRSAPAVTDQDGAAANGSPGTVGGAPTTGGAEPAENAETTPAADSTTTRPPEPSATTPDSAAPATSDRRPGSSDPSPGSLDEASASLTRTLTRFARAAEETDDPRRARDHLEAAREAAAALAALER